MLLLSLCVIGWRSPDILHAIGMAGAAQDPATLTSGGLTAGQPDKLHVDTPGGQAAANGMTPMSATEFADLAKKDPQAYQKFIHSLRAEDERSEVDKLMNFFARGKFE